MWPVGQSAYRSMIMRYKIARGGYMTMQTACLQGPDDNMGIFHRVLQQDYLKLLLLLEMFRPVKPQVKWEIVGPQKWLHRPKGMIQISTWYLVICWKSGGN